jgi:hypothetical protein
MKIEGNRQKKAKDLINSILASQGKTFTSFCRENNIDRTKRYQVLFRNKYVSLDDLNAFVALVDTKLCLSITKESIMISRK